MQEFPDNPQYEWALAEVESLLAICCEDASQYADAKDWHLRSTSRKVHLLPLLRQQPDIWAETNYSDHIAYNYRSLAVTYRRRQDFDAAEMCSREALRWRHSALRQAPESPTMRRNLLDAWTDYAELLQSRDRDKRHEKIAQIYAEAFDIADSLIEQFPESPMGLQIYMRLLTVYAHFLNSDKDVERADKLLAQVVERRMSSVIFSNREPTNRTDRGNMAGRTVSLR